MFSKPSNEFLANVLVDGLIDSEACDLSNDSNRLQFTNDLVISIASKMATLGTHNIFIINIIGAPIEDSAVKELSKLTWLEHVGLSMCRLTNHSIKYMSESLSNLKRLDVSWSLSIDDVSPLKSLKRLKYLNISHTNVKKLDLCWIKNTKLKYITFKDTPVSAEDKKAVLKYFEDKTNLNKKLPLSNKKNPLQSRDSTEVNIYSQHTLT